MNDRRPDFDLTPESANKIIEMLEWDHNTWQPKSTPSEVCQALDIDRRTFNSVVSKAIFTKHPSEPQQRLREHIMNIISNEVYTRGTE